MTAPLSSDVREAWNSKVWTHPTVLAMTDKVHLYDVLAESEFEVAKLSSLEESRINFFTCLVGRQSRQAGMGIVDYAFRVVVNYHLQQSDVAESTYNTVQDRLDAVDGLVLTTLGTTWNSTVDYFEGSTLQPIRQVTIGGLRCWQGALTYTGFKTA